MKKAKLWSVLVLAGGFLPGSQVSAAIVPKATGVPQRASVAVTVSQKDNSVAAFWERFKAAVIRSDKETVSAMSRFPISRGYGMANIRTRSQFMRRYRDLFFNETNAAQCFPKAKPMVDRERPNEFSVSCPFASDSSGEEPFVYTFTRTRAGWKLISFENINE